MHARPRLEILLRGCSVPPQNLFARLGCTVVEILNVFAQLARSPRKWRLIVELGRQIVPVVTLVPKLENLSQIELTADSGAARRSATCERLTRVQIILPDETEAIRPALEP